MELLKELFSDSDGLSLSELLGFLSGIAAVVMAFQKNPQCVAAFTFSLGCFGVNKGTSAVVKTSSMKHAANAKADTTAEPPRSSGQGVPK